MIIHGVRINVDELGSLLDNNSQFELSLSLAKFFTSNDLYNICEDILKANLDKKHDISVEEVILYRYSSYDKQLTIRDILYIDHYPSIRFIQISFRLKQTPIYNVFRYKYAPSIYNKINKILVDAYNFITYCPDSLGNKNLIRFFVLRNFSKYINNLITQSDINYLHTNTYKQNIDYMVRYNLFYKKERYIKVFDCTANIQVEIVTITDYIIKMTVYRRDSTLRHIIFLDRGAKGKGQIYLIQDILLKNELRPIEI